MWLHFINVTVKAQKSLSSKMVTQVSANFRKLCFGTLYNKTLNNFA